MFSITEVTINFTLQSANSTSRRLQGPTAMESTIHVADRLGPQRYEGSDTKTRSVVENYCRNGHVRSGSRGTLHYLEPPPHVSSRTPT